MKIFIDTEFTGLHQHTKLVSLGAVTEDNKTFYAECPGFRDGFATTEDNVWFEANVVPHMRLIMQGPEPFTASSPLGNVEVLGGTERIRAEFERFIEPYDFVQIISDCLSYDWVLFNQMWGHAFNIPDQVHYIPFDLCTLLYAVGVDPDINREEYSGLDLGCGVEKHNALWDAQVIKVCWEKCETIIKEKGKMK
jgi:hypothetical protein